MHPRDERLAKACLRDTLVPTTRTTDASLGRELAMMVRGRRIYSGTVQ